MQNPIILFRKACDGALVLKKNISYFSLFISIPEAIVKSFRISISPLASLRFGCLEHHYVVNELLVS